MNKLSSHLSEEDTVTIGNQSIENEENVTLPFEIILIIFMQICNAEDVNICGGF